MSKNNSLSALTISAAFLALLIVMGMIPGIPLGVIPVPIVVQNLGVMLITLLLGAKRGTAVMAVFMILIALGLPILSGGRGGWVVFMGPSAGYIISWLFMPIIYNGILKRLPNPGSWWVKGILLWVISIIWVYGIGTLFLSSSAHLPFWSALVANGFFIIGDTIKVVLAVIIAMAVSRMPAMAD
ncbi:biotin transporter BioY [Convivina intestini]|uniref:Biotin transporter n=1 Tax=Convivina intestini TaxID=1505726 RepID=A0A2U1DEY6_9LACO|nr:biotin transporter BioY [Convivina intestini]PVY86112.1 biotin transport system substrate-specific component [Convivina intestini]CAH1851459.1 Biotin transporter BioY [Convivina intestini]CAH1853062.1 Biotin transporter BioY [Convivina intestini]SDB80858.1 biotin transport system substrate-specific component [Leuconostocaceae bacterium R-53105]